MTIPTLPGLSSVGIDDRAAALEQEPACDVCPHPLAKHDAIGLRFCSATLSGAITRGCVCRS
jgi:hypothetical protein